METEDAQKDEPQAKEGPQAQEYKELCQRVQADFENYKKRVEREIKDAKDMAAVRVLQKFLPVLDSFEQALKQTSKQRTQDDLASLKKENEDLLKGFELLHRQLKAVFAAEGVAPITSVTFNPYEHEVLMQADSDKPQGAIIEQFQKGYKKGDAIIRHAKVKVSSGVKKNEHDKQ